MWSPAQATITNIGTPLIRSRPVFSEDAALLAGALGPAARRDLLRVLTSPSEVRADAIRQLHERLTGRRWPICGPHSARCAEDARPFLARTQCVGRMVGARLSDRPPSVCR
jgi:hypothetical protein